jgi:hypothetical protein
MATMENWFNKHLSVLLLLLLLSGANGSLFLGNQKSGKRTRDAVSQRHFTEADWSGKKKM